MTRFTHAELVDKALLVLREAADQRLRNEPVPKSHALRFALAFLSNGKERGTYDEFWRAVTAPVVEEVLASEFGRSQTINNLVAFICREHGREPVPTTEARG